MRVIDTKQIYARRRKLARKQMRVRRSFALIALAVLVAGYSYLAYQRPLPDSLAIAKDTLSSEPVRPVLAWPDYGQAAIGSKDYGLLDTNGDQKPVPIASVAKVLTALAVLKQKPFSLGQHGAAITLGEVDVAAYDYFASNDGSVVRVQAGELITEYQALQALLLPSANNMAESLAIWAFGTRDEFLRYANNLAVQLGMTDTHMSDPSGFAPETVSTASDLVRLGLAAMEEPILAQIVGQAYATIPVAGRIQNVNYQLGKDGNIGIKTGNTEAAGGCYLFASTHTFAGGQKVTLVGAILAAPSLSTAIGDTAPLLASARDGFDKVTIIPKGRAVATYRSEWGTEGKIIASEDLSAFAWKGLPLTARFGLVPVPAAAVKGTQVGVVGVHVMGAQVEEPLVLTEPLKQPSMVWRLTNFH